MSWVLQGYGRIRGMVAGEGSRSTRVLLYHESVIFFRIFGIHTFYATATLLNI